MKSINWRTLTSRRVVECIDKLLAGEELNRAVNNCSFTHLSKIIVEIRKYIGKDGIVNIPSGIGKITSYKLANDDEVKQRLLELKDEIIDRIEARKPLRVTLKNKH
jgi:hypothetical protein